MSSAFTYATSHIGLCVSDLGRALRFWVDGLGFEEFACFGGTIVDGTHSGQHDPESVQIIFLADPEGTRVELMRLAKGHAW